MKVQESTLKIRKYQKLHETKRKYQKVKYKTIKKINRDYQWAPESTIHYEKITERNRNYQIVPNKKPRKKKTKKKH